MGNLIEERDALYNTTTYEYDDLNRLVKVTAPSGTGVPTAPVTECEYDKVGNFRFVTDPLGNKTEHQYDARYRKIKTIQPDPDGAGGPMIAEENETAAALKEPQRVRKYVYPPDIFPTKGWRKASMQL